MTATGRGELELSRINGSTVLTRAMAQSPLKLLAPRSSGPSAWVFASTYGGGLVAGDSIAIRLRAAAGTCSLLGTQASTKVFPANGNGGCAQTLHATVADGATLVLMPDPITCYSRSRYEQRQQIDLEPGGSLILLDWITSGRRARGERWAMSRYHSKTNIRVGERNAFSDAVLLDEADGPLAAPWRMGRVDCVAMVVMIGAGVIEKSRRLVDWVRDQPLTTGPLLFCVTPLPDGAVLRVAGSETEPVERWLRERLSFVPRLLGDDPWTRRGHLR